KLLAQEPVTIFGNGKQERDYVFVRDVVEANVLALTKGENDTFNISVGTTTSVQQLYDEFTKLQKNVPKPKMAPPRTEELNRSVLSYERAKKLLGWKPQYTIQKGLQETFQFFQDQKKPAASKH